MSLEKFSSTAKALKGRDNNETTKIDFKNFNEMNIYLSNKDYLQSNSNNHDHEFETMWERIDELEPFERKIFRYKFDFHGFSIENANKKIEELKIVLPEAKAPVGSYVAVSYTHLTLPTKA